MTRDEFLTKAMGKCWHEWEGYWDKGGPFAPSKCKKCGISPYNTHPLLPNNNSNFCSENGFVNLLLWSQDDARTYVPQGGPEKWDWYSFVNKAFDVWIKKKYNDRENLPDFYRWLFTPERFATILAEYLGWREP